jgi:hypothetical protein
MSDEFDQPGGDREGRAWESVLYRCRVLAGKIANELRNKTPEHFVDKLSLADITPSLERAGDVLSAVNGSQAQGPPPPPIIEGDLHANRWHSRQVATAAEDRLNFWRHSIHTRRLRQTAIAEQSRLSLDREIGNFDRHSPCSR